MADAREAERRLAICLACDFVCRNVGGAVYCFARGASDSAPAGDTCPIGMWGVLYEDDESRLQEQETDMSNSTIQAVRARKQADLAAFTEHMTDEEKTVFAEGQAVGLIEAGYLLGLMTAAGVTASLRDEG